jgi:hypothetical protein
MKKMLVLAAVLISAAMFSCKHVEEKVVPIVPNWSVTEWDYTLSNPVENSVANVERFYLLPDEVFTIFTPDKLKQFSASATAFKAKNNLPGDAYYWSLNARYMSWPIGQGQKKWDGTLNPADYVYMIWYDNSFIALWFTDATTLHCQRLEKPDGTERPEFVEVPASDKLQRVDWIFTGLSYDCQELAQGRAITHSSEYGRTTVTTRWKGGTYKLPNAYTRISIGDKVIYSD